MAPRAPRPRARRPSGCPGRREPGDADRLSSPAEDPRRAAGQCRRKLEYPRRCRRSPSRGPRRPGARAAPSPPARAWRRYRRLRYRDGSIFPRTIGRLSHRKSRFEPGPVARLGSAIHSVLDAAQDGHDLLGAEIGVEQIEWDDTAERTIRLLEPSPGMFALAQDVLGDCRHPREAQQAVRLVGAETPLLLSPRQGSGGQTDHPRQREHGNAVARSDDGERGEGEAGARPVDDGGVVGQPLLEDASASESLRDLHGGDHGPSCNMAITISPYGIEVNEGVARLAGFAAGIAARPLRGEGQELNARRHAVWV